MGRTVKIRQRRRRRAWRSAWKNRRWCPPMTRHSAPFRPNKIVVPLAEANLVKGLDLNDVVAVKAAELTAAGKKVVITANVQDGLIKNMETKEAPRKTSMMSRLFGRKK